MDSFHSETRDIEFQEKCFLIFEGLFEWEQEFREFMTELWQRLDKDTLNWVSVSLDTPFEYLNSLDDLKKAYQSIKSGNKNA